MKDKNLFELRTILIEKFGIRSKADLLEFPKTAKWEDIHKRFPDLALMDEMKIKSWLSNENKLSNTKIRSVGVIMCGSSLAWDLSNSSVAPTSASKPYVCAKCRRSFPNEGARSRHYNAQESCSPYVRLEICFKPIDMSKQN